MPDDAQLTAQDIDAIFTWTLVRAARRAVHELTEVLAGYDLTPVQFGVLAQLAVDGSATQAALARATFLRPQSMGTLVEAMAHRGLLEWTAPRGRGRRAPLQLTAAGARLLHDVRGPVMTTNDLSWAGINHDDAAALNAHLLHLVHDTDTAPATQLPKTPGAQLSG